MTLKNPTTWILVFDGGKRLLFEDIGFPDAPHLKLRADSEIDLPPDRELHRDRPGRLTTSRYRPIGGSADKTGGAMEPNDRHQQLEKRFVRNTAHLISKRSRSNAFQRLVLLAPPRAMGEFKRALGEAEKKCVVAELQGDYVNAPTIDIERAYLAAMARGHSAA